MKRSLKLNVLLGILKQCLTIIYPIITIPYVSRILEVNAYGMVNFSKSIVDYFALVAGLGIANYAIREGAFVRKSSQRFEEFASQIFTLNFVALIISFSALLGLVFFSNNHKIVDNRALILVFSSIMWLNTFGVDWVNSVYEDYLYLTIRYLIIQIVSLFLLFAFVRSKDDFLLYSIINVFSTAGGNFVNFFYIRRYCVLRLTKLKDCKKHLSAILLLFGNALANTIYISSDITILGLFWGNHEVGIYSLASKVYFVIKQLTNAAINITVPRLSMHFGEGDVVSYRNLLAKVRDYLLSFILPISIATLFLSRSIVEAIAGVGYIEGIITLRILSIAILFSTCACFLVKGIMLPYSMDIQLLVTSVVSAMLNIILNIFLIPIWSYNGAAITTLLAEIAMVIGALIFLRGKKELVLFFSTKKNIIWSSLVGSATVAVICFLCELFIVNCYYCICLSFVIGVIAYILVAVIMRNDVIVSVLEGVIKRCVRNRM